MPRANADTSDRILVIEDEPDIALGLQVNLEVEGYEVVVAHTGMAGLREARAFRPGLILLDLMLPDIDGYEVLRRLRDAGFDTPVIVLTARGEELDKVRGFRAGADDYVTKPFGVMELMLRVRAILRRGVRSEETTDATHERFGRIEVDVDGRVVRRDGAEVGLTPKGFELLLALLRRADKTVSRVELLRDVWGYEADVMTRTIDAHVAELRRKLEDDPAEPVHILTVQKVGYRLKR